jgi:hypothetical protein
MAVRVPLIYTRQWEPQRLAWSARLASLGLCLGCLGMLLVALWLRPDPSGVSSHRQLGLPPCDLLARTGVPCMTCGMTTSFSHFVRGHILGSFYVQPMGAVLSLLTVMGFWACLYIAISARPAHRLLWHIPSRYYLLFLFSLAILAWAWKIGIHRTGHDGWPS